MLAIVTFEKEETKKFPFDGVEILQDIHSELIKSNKSNMEEIIKNAILNNLNNKL